MGGEVDASAAGAAGRQSVDRQQGRKSTGREVDASAGRRERGPTAQRGDAAAAAGAVPRRAAGRPAQGEHKHAATHVHAALAQHILQQSRRERAPHVRAGAGAAVVAGVREREEVSALRWVARDAREHRRRRARGNRRQCGAHAAHEALARARVAGAAAAPAAGRRRR
eukprot:365647-Chlamydomonas_euryale.AAC.13